MPHLTPAADLAVFLVSVGAGLIGALGGVGGGLIIVPALIILFGVDVQVAAGASIVAVIATSSGAAAAYVRDGLANMRIGMFLELATTTGAVVGALLAGILAPQLLMVLLAVILLLSAGMQVLRLSDPPGSDIPPQPGRLRLVGEYHSVRLGRTVAYGSRRVPFGFGMMWIAGVASGMLGIGSGALKVVAMDGVMRLPMKVSSATSNFIDRRHRGGLGGHLPGTRRRGRRARGARRPRGAHRRGRGLPVAGPALQPARPPHLHTGAGGHRPGDAPASGGDRRVTEARFARIVSLVLLVGVTVSAVLIGVGFVAALVFGWSGSGPDATVDPADFSDLPERLRALQPLAITQLGLLVLIATPVVRVGFSVVGFALERDRLYVAITVAVLAVLLGSLLLAR